MAKLIGIVSKVIGQVFAVEGDGTRRALVEGDRLFAGEQLVTGAAGAVAVHMTDGTELTLGRDSSLQLTPQLLAHQAPHVDAPEALTPSEAQLTDVEKLQAAIQAGVDPTQDAEATAAGPNGTTAAGALGGGHSFVLLSEVAGHVDPVIGFPTAGFGGIPEFVDREVAGTVQNDTTPVAPNNLVTLTGLSVEGGELTVTEASLPQGSASNPSALTQSGTFSVSAPDGLLSLSVGGINVVSAGVAAGFPQSVVTGLGSTLTVTGYNAATGVVSYSYTLNGNEMHSAGDGANSLSEHFTVVANDTNGDSATNTLDVNITDDVPHAVNDSNESTASESMLTLTGSVLPNDTQGADRIASGPVTPGTYTGTYGTLVLNADGSYVYTLNTADPDFSALHGGGNGTENFLYTLNDSDGDTSTATLVLNIHNNDDPVLIRGLNVEGGEATVYEKNLTDGSSPNAGALTQSGTFTVTALDGLQTLTVGGITVVSGGAASGFPQSMTTGLGNTLTVTGYNETTGVVSYSYTLLDNEMHPAGNGINSLSESFNVVATDTDGSTASASLDVNVVDDVPTAVNDSNAGTASESLLTLTGTVLPNDTQGADRIPTGPVTAGTFTGTFGTLVLNADGSYVYTLNTADPDFKGLHGGGNGTENFVYTLNDSDGDTSTATLVLNIHNNDDGVTLTGLDVNGGELTVYEKNLTDGSAPNTPALTQSGTFTVTALDGLQTLTVGGITVVSGGAAAGFPQSATTGLGNTLTITGYNETTGVISYSYTLVGNDMHPAGNGINSLSESFSVVATDTDGSTASASLDVNVIDDVPTAVNDSNAGTASESLLTLTGTVLPNDIQGADRIPTGPVTAGTFTGTYGTLVLNANGTYVYTLNTADPDFKGLHGGGNGTENFVYTLNDSDGDTSTATLVLNIHNNDDGVTLTGLDVNGGELTVYEKNLTDGSSPSTPALTQSGTFTVTALDGLQTLTVGGITVVSGGAAAGFPQSATTTLGNTLTITGYNETTGVISYSYTLVGNDMHPAGNGINSLSESFNVVATDTDGSTASASLDVNVIDDVPTAVNDSNAGTASESMLTLSGTVLPNDTQGADRIPSGPVTAGTFTGTFGTLVLHADGSYVYTLNTADADFKGLHGGGNGTENFVYTLNDSDGDTSTATLVLNIHNNDDGVTLTGLDVNGGELTVYEKNLTDGSAPNTPALTQSGTFTVTALDGLQTLSVGGITVVSGGAAAGFPQSATTGLGNTLTITGYNAATGVVSYSYTLLDNEAHPTGNGINSLSESFNVVATDTDGSTASASLDVNVIDDVPTAVNDSNAGTASESMLTLTGTVLPNDTQGADRIPTGPITAGTFTGTYGTLVLNANGTYVYTLNTADPDFKGLHGGGNGTENFVYTLNDSDGDTSTATLVLNIHNNDDGVTLTGLDVNGGELTVYEKNLTDGSAPSTPALTQSGTFTVTALDGLQTLTVGGITVVSGGAAAGFPQSATTTLGNTLTITGYNETTGVISYSYTLVGNDMHPAGNGINSLSESFNVVATDTDGSTASASLDVNVIDDVPTAVNDSNPGTASESLLTLTGTVLPNDTQGADRIPTGPITAGTFTGTYGTLVLNANGSYVYTLNTADPDFKGLHGGGNGTENFVYTLNDSDGDTSTATLVLNIHNNDDGVTLTGLNVNGGELTVYEKNLSDGSAPNTPALTQSGTFTVTALDGLQTLNVGGITVVSGGVAAGFPQSISTGLGNTLTITGYNATTGVVSYSYTLLDNETHPTANGANNLVEQFTVTASDTDGSSASGIIDVNIIDDLPTANPDTAQVLEGATVSTNVFTNDVQGADGATVVGIKTGSDTANAVTTGLNTTIVGTYGTLTLNAAGLAVYHSNPNSVSPPGAQDVFTYSIRDSDGDLSTTTLTINVTDCGLTAVTDQDVTVYEKALDLTKDGQDLAAGTVIGSDPTATTETASGTLVGSATGGTGPISFSLVGSASGNLTGTYGQIHLNSDGTYTYTLTSAPKTTPNANDGPNVLTESFAYKATDALGNIVTSNIVISIVDDVPKAVSSDRSVTTVQVDSNLLLIIDVSGSMADASGVPGLSRLALAKQAISALLDKYDDMGDVKVQVVTFSTNATDRTAVWVDIATAKTIVNGLTAGGNTNYDAGVATGEAAFNTSGKLVGAQNVAYFFSDGNPTNGNNINATDEVAYKAFLDANGIKSYAIGLGSGVNSVNLDPLAYDGSTHTDTNSVVVTDLSQLNNVLAGTVQGAPVTGSLLTDGSFGADGGFLKSLLVDGVMYTYDPKANGNQGGMTVVGTSAGTFDTTTNSISINTAKGGTLIVDMDTGEYTYTPPKVVGPTVTENFGFVLTDNDGDLGTAQLVIHVNANSPPVAVDDHVITNVLSNSITVPGELLLANDSDPDGDPLSAAPTTFATGWIAKNGDFTGSTAVPAFNGTANSASNQILNLARSAFTDNTAMMTAVAVVTGYLAAANGSVANAQDVINLGVKQGETLNLDINLDPGHVAMEWRFTPTGGAAGVYSVLADGGTLTAASDGTYSIHITNITNTSGTNTNAAENYQLTMTVNYAGGHDITPDYHGTYTASDSHGGSDSANVSISYQDGHILTGTSADDILVAGTGDNILYGNDGNDVLTAGTGNNSLYGGNGDDLLFSGPGNDLLDGGAGNDTASYAHATAGVTVNLGVLGQQNTIGAGMDTLVSIENLIGSNYNDTLTGDNNANRLVGGLGNDTLNGGGGDDLLIGGMGNNTLTGGPGADTFQWLQGNTGHDVVTDFAIGTDKLDLSQLLQGENSSAASLDDYLHFKVTGSGATLVSSIDISSVAGAAPTQTIDLAGVNLATHYGVTPGAGGAIAGGADTASIINGMISDHSLKVDTV